MSQKENLENSIKALFELWVEEKNKEKLKKIRYSGPSFGKEEYTGIMDAIFSDWWSGGKFTFKAEEKLAELSERNSALLTNSGSSANLILMGGAKELYFKDGDKILTLACGFPTTVNPIITNRLIPVFVDIDLEDLSLAPEIFEDAIKKDKKIKGLFIAHTLGFAGKINEILDIARKYNIQVFFDNCDAYACTYKGKPLPAYGKASSYSFYVAHHITMGEGGAVSTNDEDLHTVMKGLRSWGRYCACKQCCIRAELPNSFCPKNKFTKDADLPKDYIVNYQYEWLGYNLKPLDLQAAMLLAQIEKMPKFNDQRIKNYNKLLKYFKSLKFDFKLWDLQEGVSPFAFPIILPKDAPFTRKHLIDGMTRNGVETRLLFGGNLMRHPAYVNSSQYWEAMGKFDNSNLITDQFIMFGVSQVNDDEITDEMINKIDDFMNLW
jgi:CDP-6-deoxy-D-xylo-4-hexulose-3-dehydrase